ncbi:MAG: hypothetical protein IK066_04855, partial [Kiritimatiellae bacterium]|nr:hypothetical protein [Kiritimatiellia bacterium]
RTAWGAFRALWPLWAVLGAAGAAGVWVVHRGLSGSVMKTGRTLFEMAHYSPPASGLTDGSATGMPRHAYLGWPLLALVAASGSAAAAWGRGRGDGEGNGDGRWRVTWIWAGFGLCALIVLLGLGIHAPPAGIWARAARKLVPGYGMIRQTVKAYAVLPMLLAAPLAGCFAAVFESGGGGRGRVAARWALAALAAWATWDGLWHTKAGLTVLPRSDDSNLAIFDDARLRGDETPRALAIPLWPGDSHWSSVYEYATMLRGVRWVNGYSAMTPDRYAEEVYERFAGINQGAADDRQLDALLGMGVRYIEVFPQAFPDKVSPWPPGVTVRRLTANPRLTPVWDADDDGRRLQATFAFRILARGEARGKGRVANWRDATCPASWHWKFADEPTNVAAGKKYDLLLRAPVADIEGRRVEFRVAPASSWPVGQERGGGAFAEAAEADGLPEWEDVPMENGIGEILEAGPDGFTLEHAFVGGGVPWKPGADGAWNVTPALQWHGGAMRPGRPEVRFTPDRTADGVALYGPQLPVPAGRYQCEVRFDAEPDDEADDPADPGDSVGWVRVASFRDGRVYGSRLLQMGDRKVLFDLEPMPSDPVRIEIAYCANAALTIRAIRLIPVP